MEKEMSGMVFVAFQLNEEGEVTTAMVTKGVDPLLDIESLRVVRLMSGWGMSKEVKYTGEITTNIPIEFKL